VEKKRKLAPLFWGILLFLSIILLAGELNPPPPAPTATPDPLSAAQVFRDAGDLAGEAGYWTSILAQDPNNPQAHFNLALVNTLIKPDEVFIHLNQAERYAAYAAPAGRLKSTLRLVGFSEDPAYANILTGQALAAEGQWQLAEIAFTRSTQANPGYAEAWAYLGEAQQRNGLDGYQALETALELDPKSFAANVFMGMYWRRQGKPENGLLYLKSADQIAPGNFVLQVDIANTLAEIGNIDDALSYMQKIIDADPVNVFAWQALALFSIDNEVQVDTIGLSAARQAVILEKNNAASLTLLGRVFAYREDGFNTQKFLQRALEADPYYAPAHLHLGIFYLSHAQKSKALEHFHLAEKFAQDQTTFQQARDFIQRFSTN